MTEDELNTEQYQGSPEAAEPGHAHREEARAVEQDIIVEVNVLNFLFDGVFTENAFRDSVFYFTDVHIDVQIDAENRALLTAGSESADHAGHLGQQTLTEVNIFSFQFLGDVRDYAFENVQFYFDGIEIDVGIRAANGGDLVATNGAHLVAEGEGAGGGAGGPIAPAFDQRAGLDLDVLVFAIGGTFGGSMFQGEVFDVTDLSLHLRAEVANAADLAVGNGGGGDAEGWIAHALGQRAVASVDVLTFEFSGEFSGDAFREAEFRFTNLAFDLRIDAANTAALAAGDAGSGTAELETAELKTVEFGSEPGNLLFGTDGGVPLSNQDNLWA